MAMVTFLSKEARQLLHNKFVVILGDSIQRSVYKDLVLLLQKDLPLSSSQLRDKGELSFEQDCLVEGGQLDKLHNGTRYREVRQYRTGHHLVRFYFLTRIYSDYLESVLADFQAGPQPDLVIINSCVWDVSRYGSSSMREYRLNLQRAFVRLNQVLPRSCLLIWNMALPLGGRVSGGFLVPEVQHLSQRLREDVIEGNFYSAMAAGRCGFDVLDLHYHFRFATCHRQRDGIHWNSHVHRWLSHLLLTHVADAWGVHIPGKTRRLGSFQDNHPAPDAWASSPRETWAAPSRPWVPETPRYPLDRWSEDEAQALYGLPAGACPLPHPAAESNHFQEDAPLLPGPSSSSAFCSGYSSFDHSGAPGSFQDNYSVPGAWASSPRETWAAPSHPWGHRWKNEARAPYGLPEGPCPPPLLAAESSPFHEDTPLLPGPSSSAAFCSGYISFDHSSAPGAACATPVPYPLGRPGRARHLVMRPQPLARTPWAPYRRPLPSRPRRY